MFSAAKAGHTGTLDPLATGLLPLCFGEATKFSADLLDADKTYDADVLFGVTTDTGDADGVVIRQCQPVFGISNLEAAMEGKMSAERFSWLWRGRRSNGSYLGAVLAAARLSGHPQREIMICRSVTTRLNAPRFARRLAELTGAAV